MAKLYPPLIEGSIPAFCGASFTVPFSMNRSVGQAEVSGIALIVKTIQSNSFLFETETNTVTYGVNTCSATFNLNATQKAQLHTGQFYKIQIAYINVDINNIRTVGYYSTVGVVKYTAMPTAAYTESQAE